MWLAGTSERGHARTRRVLAFPRPQPMHRLASGERRLPQPLDRTAREPHRERRTTTEVFTLAERARVAPAI